MTLRPTAPAAILLLALGLSPLAWGQSSSTTLPADVQPAPAVESTTGNASTILKNKKFEDDHKLTDAKLRADDGSLSRYSLKFSMSYYGPTLNDWGAADQPNPNGSRGPYTTSLGGSFMGRYRLSPDRAISVGGGMKAVHPLNGGKRMDINTPFINYDMASRIGGWQMRNSPGFSYVTIPEYTADGERYSVGWDTSVVHDLGSSRFAFAMDTNFGYYIYNRGYQASDGKANQYSLTLAPALKYNFSDAFSVNTSIGWVLWNPRLKNDQSTLWNNMASQRIGIGYAIDRDVYFAPYVSTYINRYAWDTTTFNFSTIFSLL